ncbi:helix-turn-helix domain-containing protein [Rugosibacter aromaticivorans]|uniref:helix-turn-helix domain-containing protein n=1 Tax=Rugosibacter aromaticivorans TaxID=1565605 RepID=UPI00121466CB|nr:MAG: helix-turn-helix domain-containing protein [Rugosibacter sp.]
MNYTHITQEERYQIYALKKAGHTQSEIASVLERKSTISGSWHATVRARLSSQTSAEHGGG